MKKKAYSPATMTEDSIKAFGISVPMGRVGQPVEIATAFAFLASADSSYIRYVAPTARIPGALTNSSGQVVRVNGGVVTN